MSKEQRSLRKLTIKTLVRKKFRNRKPILIHKLPKQLAVTASYEHIKSIISSSLFSPITWSLGYTKARALENTNEPYSQHSTANLPYVSPNAQFSPSISLQSLLFM
jgi:hypothetical protein